MKNINENNYVCSILTNGQTSPLIIPSFMWGCCLGSVGIAIVFFTFEGEPEQIEETKKAIYGGLVLVGVSIILNLVIFNTSTM